jgi:hypothetical protein
MEKTKLAGDLRTLCIVLIVVVSFIATGGALTPRPAAGAIGITGAAKAPSDTSLTFVITWSAGCETPPADAVTALDYAAGLWSGWITSSVPIEVTACWTDNLESGDTLGTGMPTAYYANFANAPLTDVQYPAALANALSGADLDPARAEITVQFKASAPWSFATTSPPTSTWDFVTVALHELAHGLGFISNMYEDYSVGFCGNGLYGYLYPCPTPYDWFATDSGGVPLLDYMMPDPRDLGDRLKSDANFAGPNTITANGGAAKLYTPGAFTFGSSLSHLDSNTFNFTANALMTPSYSSATRHPGPVTLSIIQDIGWLRADGVPNAVTAGPRIVGVGEPAALTAALVWSAYTGQPVAYTWTAEEQSPVTHPGQGNTDSTIFTWDAPGEKRITVSATDGAETAQTTRTVVVFDVTASGITKGDTNSTYTFYANVVPGSAGHTITYTWEATDMVSLVHPDTVLVNDSAAFTWTEPGTKTITVTAAIAGAAAQAIHVVEIEGLVLDQHVYLPLVNRD